MRERQINDFEKETLLYQGTNVWDLEQEKLIIQEIESAGIKTIDQNSQWPLVTQIGTNDAGKKVHYSYNYTPQKSSWAYQNNSGIELITRKL